jgi:hypothetical protein
VPVGVRDSSASGVRDYIFCKASRPSLGSVQRPTQWVAAVKRPGRGTDHSYFLVSRLRRSGAVPPLPICFRSMRKDTFTCYLACPAISITTVLCSVRHCFFVHSICHKHRAGWCSSNTVDVLPGGRWSNCRPD